MSSQAARKTLDAQHIEKEHPSHQAIMSSLPAQTIPDSTVQQGLSLYGRLKAADIQASQHGHSLHHLAPVADVLFMEGSLIIQEVEELPWADTAFQVKSPYIHITVVIPVPEEAPLSQDFVYQSQKFTLFLLAKGQ